MTTLSGMPTAERTFTRPVSSSLPALTSRKNLPDNLSDRLEILQLPMGSQRVVPLVNAYAQTMPNSDHTKDKLYKEDDTITTDVLPSEKFFILGDFSARVAAQHASLRLPLVENVLAMYH